MDSLCAESMSEERANSSKSIAYGEGRQALIDAAVRVVARGGLRALTYRSVAEDNPHIDMEDGVSWERLAVGDDHGPADAFLVTYAPGATSSVEGKLMRHAGVEYGYIMEGELTLQLEFDTFVLKAGDSLHFDSVRPHRYVNDGKTAARGVWFHLGRREQPT